ncbi:hypothetical protein LOC68_13135 [Blastopirellula sp. JC732]|uniref:Carboxypeptidase regulatory-like domain-containing protein n=1 Tax=Blastopirellula sediminis TaxID=2894196 RepID=A0A9X1MN53_9BACT|nr:hypothetical protein [Blastopirellula sediminis]MCC9607365.1 hypothetical protein [Blastopirellula sediminis]MCC9629342.1 hypothetical protein [Blastopirellula sediminis]
MRKYLCLFVLLAAGVGCGGPASYHVEGHVKYDGKPVEEGAIILRDLDEKFPSVRAEIVNGGYAMDVTPGKKIVQVRATRKTGRKIEANPGEIVEEVAEFIPRKHNFESELTIEVAGNQQDLNFDLEK